MSLGFSSRLYTTFLETVLIRLYFPVVNALKPKSNASSKTRMYDSRYIPAAKIITLKTAITLVTFSSAFSTETGQLRFEFTLISFHFKNSIRIPFKKKALHDFSEGLVYINCYLFKIYLDNILPGHLFTCHTATHCPCVQFIGNIFNSVIHDSVTKVIFYFKRVK